MASRRWSRRDRGRPGDHPPGQPARPREEFAPDVNEGLADLDRTISGHPGDAYAISSRGQLHLVLGHYNQALADLNRAAGLVPDDAWTLAARGL
jgi:hypothetical protein